jgi:hypothetical protein
MATKKFLKISLAYLCNLGPHQTVKGNAHIAHFPLKPLYAIELFGVKKKGNDQTMSK